MIKTNLVDNAIDEERSEDINVVQRFALVAERKPFAPNTICFSILFFVIAIALH